MSKELTVEQRAARDVLNQVVDLLNEGNRNLWRVLTALRGPDDENDALKVRTTCVIRHIIGMENGACGAIVNDGTVLLPEYGIHNGPRVAQFHFNSHLRLAVESLRKLGFEFETEEQGERER